jgi:signal transduction histidine kinase
VVKPLRRLAEAARAITAGDYSQRVEEKGPREIRTLAATFNQMVEEVQHTQEGQRDFLANVSHELKTPLTSIQGYSQAVLDGAVTDPARAASVIYDEAGRMRRLVEELLDLARLESGQARLRRAHVDLSALLGAVIERMTPQARERGVSLEHEVRALPGLTGDGDRLAQVFANLIDNAIEHTPNGGRVLVRAVEVDGGVEASISDTGHGISPEDLDRIFERFYQVDKSRVRGERKGTGLGLTISKELVEAHGGRIRAVSTLGQGATFIVWLPLPRPSDETVSRMPAATRGRNGRLRTG